MKVDIREIIKDTVRELTEGELIEAALAGTNFYRTMENLLYSYKKVKRQLDDMDEYGFEPVQKSKDISVAPPKGSGVRDFSEVHDEAVKERMRSYLRTQQQFDELDRVVKQFESNRYFIIIRMFYFGEDAEGNDVDSDERRTLEDIANELDAAGFEYGKTRKTVGKKKTELVQDMTVAMFGKAGALSIEMYKARKAQSNVHGVATAHSEEFEDETATNKG